MTTRFDDIGDRLKAFRLGSGLGAEEIAARLGISRSALYRFEKGDLVKIETLERLSQLLDVSMPTLMGVGVEYIGSAVSFFERLRQIEEQSEHITVLAGSVSYLLASGKFDNILPEVLRESLSEETDSRLSDLLGILSARKKAYQRRQPGILNLVSGAEIERFLRNGLVGNISLPASLQSERRLVAQAEAMHLADLMESQPIGIQVGIIPGTLPHNSFQIFRQVDRRLLALSPFRLGEQPNISVGIAMITSAEEALTLHLKMAEEMWNNAKKGPEGAQYLRSLVEIHGLD
ncbi:MAG: helix-turn-helix transcriptional regulator [Pseudomonadota bacterium]|nr:helix-turn-helix transcriptional regulator [Pseudomonadota bacterium]